MEAEADEPELQLSKEITFQPESQSRKRSSSQADLTESNQPIKLRIPLRLWQEQIALQQVEQIDI